MTGPATRPLPRTAYRRGTRAFAALVTGLAGAVVLAVGVVVVPSMSLGEDAFAWLVLLTVAFGIAHVVAVVGLIWHRAWSGRLVGYLAASGIGVAAYGLLLSLTGADPFGATSRLPSARAWAEGVGLLIWMIGLWAVAARFAVKGVAPIAGRAGAGRDVADRPVARAAGAS